jgi:hypothetical protein
MEARFACKWWKAPSIDESLFHAGCTSKYERKKICILENIPLGCLLMSQ